MDFISSSFVVHRAILHSSGASVFISFCHSFLGTLCCSIKKIESPYMFDWEYGIALYAMQGNRASFPSEGDVSYVFSSCSKKLRYIREFQGDGHSKLHFVQESQNTCEVMKDTSGI